MSMYYSSSGDSMSEDNDTERHLQHLADRTLLELLGRDEGNSILIVCTPPKEGERCSD